jgi:magnesium transporter
MSDAILFERERVDHLEALADRPRQLSASMLLWVDLQRGSATSAAEVAEEFELDDGTRASLANPQGPPAFDDRGRYIHLTIYAPCEDHAGELDPVECVVGQNWVVTAHHRPIPVLEEFAERASGSGDIGSLDGPSFLAALLEWVLGSYTAAFERMEQRLEQFDVQAMRGGGADGAIEALVEMRVQLGQLRRALAAHRGSLVALTHPELEALGDDTSSERFQSLFARFEATLQEAREVREAIVGSFDVLSARSSDRTNEIMKVLTFASVLVLPGTLLAGIMGMNFHVPIFDHPAAFWLVIAAIIATAASTITVAVRRRWI